MIAFCFTSGPCPSIPLAHPPPARSRGIAFYPHRAASHSIIACLISFRITSSLRSAQTNRLESDGDSEHALYFSRDLTGLALPAPRPPRRRALARSPGRRQHKRRRAPPPRARRACSPDSEMVPFHNSAVRRAGPWRVRGCLKSSLVTVDYYL